MRVVAVPEEDSAWAAVRETDPVGAVLARPNRKVARGTLQAARPGGARVGAVGRSAFQAYKLDSRRDKGSAGLWAPWKVGAEA